MVAKLVTLGDSLSHGFQHGAIRRAAWSYPAMVARALGAESFRQADFSGGGVGGPLVDLELVMRRLANEFGRKLDVWDLFQAALSVRSFMSEVEDYWERGDGTRASGTGPIHHNLAVWGFEVLDALNLSDTECFLNTPPPTNNLIDQIPESAMYRSARRVFNPAQLPALGPLTPVQLAQQLAQDEGGIENLIVELGSNNALGTCVKLKVVWSEATDLQKLAHERSCTLWRPEHFERLYADLMAQVERVGAERVFLATVPHVTVAPVTRGVSLGTPELVDGYYEYYTRFWIWDSDFAPSDPHLTREQAMLIDSVIDRYNDCIRRTAAERGYHVIDLCKLLDDLAYRRSGGNPPYRFPDGLVQALKNDPMTLFRVLPDNTLLLDTRYLQVPDQPLASDPSSDWRWQFKGGLFGLDGVHPTTIGYGVIAHEVLKCMQAARVPGADPSLLPWNRIVAADTLITDTPPILSSLERTLDFLFGKLKLEQLIEKLAGRGAENA